MAELFTEHWWYISLAIAVAVVLAVVHRVSANIAFDVSYRKGFFTQGALFGLFLGLPGIIFVNTWRQIDSPNSANQQQLEQTPDGGQERWAGVLAQVCLGLGLFYYQLVVQVFLHAPQLGSAWFWLAALCLLTIGWYQFRGCYPPYAMMPPLLHDDYADPPDLVEMATKRHEWGLVHERRLITSNLANAAAWAGGSGAIALYLTTCLPLPFSPWIAGVICFLVMVLGTAGWYLLRRRADALDQECDQLILASAPDDQQRTLVRLKMDFFADLHRMRQIYWVRIGMVIVFALPVIISLLIAIIGGRYFHYLVAGLIVIALVFVARIVTRRYEELDRVAHGLEARDRRIGELTREVEIAAIARAREQSREEVGEVYTFEMGDLVGRRTSTADDVPAQPQPTDNDPQLKAEIERDERDRAFAYAQVAIREAEFFQHLRGSRAWAAWGGVGILGLLVVLDLLGYKPIAAETLKYTALGCFILALATFLPERFPALRDLGSLKVLERLCAAAVIIAVGCVLVFIRPGI